MAGTADTPIEAFIRRARADHADALAAMPQRLEAAWPLLRGAPEATADFAALAEHVLLGHLGDADALARWLDRLAPLALEHPPAASRLARARLALALLRGDAAEPAALSTADVIAAHGSAAEAAAVRRDAALARRLLDAAERPLGPAADPAAVKAFAAMANNLASRLLEVPRDAGADALMLEAAERAQRRWHQAGTWLEAERAEYLLGLCAAATGDGTRALRHATACLSLCTAHGADALERCFAHEALGRASLAAGDRAGAAEAAAHMRALVDALDADDSAWARAAWERLAHALGPG